MASVWTAQDSLLARQVAVKTLHPELAVDDSLRTRFRNEAIAVASLAHPDIVATYDTGEDDGVAYFVMELVDGPNLRVLLDQQGELSVPEAMRVARGVTAALDHAHRNGIVHRDIKPANVLVPPYGPVKVTDFGIAKAEGSGDLTRAGTVVGTARYLAPEQVQAAPVDARTDVYAVGLLLFEMLAGHSPFQGDTDMEAALARLTVAPPPLRELRPDVPTALEAITTRCLALAPENRFPDAHTLLVALDKLADDSDDDAGRVLTGSVAPQRRLRPSRRRHPSRHPVQQHHRGDRRGGAAPRRGRGRSSGCSSSSRAPSPASSWSERHATTRQEGATPPASAHRSSMSPTSTPRATRPSTPSRPTPRSTATLPPRGRRSGTTPPRSVA